MMFTLQGARVILADDILETTVTVSDDRIVEIGGAVQGQVIDARNRTLAPAMIDVHGDAFERQVMPRPGVYFPLDTAVIDTDRQLTSNGIATAYHAVTLSWEPGLRDVTRGRDLINAFTRLAPRLTAENRVQLRWETFAFDAIAVIEEALKGPLLPSIAFNDHTSMMMRGFDVPIQDRAFEFSPDFTIASLDDPRMAARTTAKTKRSGLSHEAYMALLRQVWAQRPDVPGKIAEVAALGRKAGAPMLSHDDTRAETREFFQNHGAYIAEFPMVMEAALAARQNGDPIIFGAPNATRGGSHIGSLAAADMIEDGLCDALASDYFYPAMLAAITRLHHEMRAPLPQLWSLVSAGPARAMGLADRGQIALGQRADLVLLDWPDRGTPSVETTWVAGRTAYFGKPSSF
ncbi:MAG: alpha-D-ribose 1-methylphosphonate 5-triphosphate diphosphatase [Pseudomonadota bacterium]